MNNMVSIKESKKARFANEIYDYLNPDYLYIPLEEGSTLNIDNNNYVHKEQVLLSKKNKFVYSPISGKVIGGTESMKGNNKDLKCIVIENDFRERVNHKKGTKKNISDYTKEEFCELLQKYNALEHDIDIEAKTLVISGIDKDPYEKTFSVLINIASDKLLEAIDAIVSILGIKNTIFALNIKDKQNVDNLKNHVGTYPNITLKLMPDMYPIGFEEVLIPNVLTRRQFNNGYIFMTVQDVYTIYNVLRRKKPITEKLVTLGGDAIEEPKVINVKIGTSLNDIIKNCCKITNNKYFVVVNGILAGKTIESLNNVVTSETRSIFLNTYDCPEEDNCINCGLCTRLCPVGLNPKYIKEHPKANKDRCIHCNLCTYICPAKINFKKCLGGKDNE